MIRESLALVVALTAGPLATAAVHPAELDERALEGAWAVAIIEDNGGRSEPSRHFYKFDRGRMFMIWHGQPADTVKKMYTVFPDENPKQMDFKTRWEYTRAIYRLDGDTLQICQSLDGPDATDRVRRRTKSSAGDSQTHEEADRTLVSTR